MVLSLRSYWIVCPHLNVFIILNTIITYLDQGRGRKSCGWGSRCWPASPGRPSRCPPARPLGVHQPEHGHHVLGGQNYWKMISTADPNYQLCTVISSTKGNSVMLTKWLMLCSWYTKPGGQIKGFTDTIMTKDYIVLSTSVNNKW